MDDTKKQPQKNTRQFVFEELKTLTDKIHATEGMPKDLVERLDQMVQRLDRMAKLGHYASEFDTLSRYIEIITSVPWTKETEDILDLKRTKELLDENHYGMDYVKERILEYLASVILLKKREQDALSRAPIMLLVGLQGVGKTTLAISVADALGRKFVRIAMGGLGSTLELRGQSKSLPSSEPGQIVKALLKTGVRNPLILLDFYD